MKQMKLWDNDLCPCCQQVTESTTMHLYLCPHPTVAMAREKSFHKILTWLDTIVLGTIKSLLSSLRTTKYYTYQKLRKNNYSSTTHQVNNQPMATNFQRSISNIFHFQ